MAKILANDGISASGVEALKSYGYEVSTTNVAQEQLENHINSNEINVLLVRSATTVRKELIDACESLKIIGRGGVGMDNIDVDYAREKGLHVINTPAASSASVAELVFAHLYGGVRYLFDANRQMPLEGDTKFKVLKKNYAASFSGFKTNVLYFLRKQQQLDKNYIQNHRNDLCSSMQHILVNILMEKLDKAVIQTGIKEIVIGGGVSANSGLRHALSKKTDWNVYLPPLSFTTDNAAMIAVAGYFKYQNNNFGVLNRQAQSRIFL